MTAITRANLAEALSTTAATSFTTASVTPAANQVVLICIGNTATSGAPPTSVTGNGITYTMIVAKSSGTKSCSIWWGASGSPAAGTITIDFGGVSQATCFHDVEQLTSADQSNPVVQSQTGSGTGTAGSLSSALAAFRDAANDAGFYIVVHASNESTTAAGSWTQLFNASNSGPAMTRETAWISGGGAPNPQPAWATSVTWVMAAVEMGVPVASPGVVAMVA